MQTHCYHFYKLRIDTLLQLMLPNSCKDFSQAFAVDLGNISQTNDFRLCHPNNFNPSHQITQSEKMLIITTCRNRALYLLANLVQKSYFLRTYSKNYYAFIHTFFICHAPQPPMKQVVTSQFKIECFLNSSDSFWKNISLLYKFDIGNLLKYPCVSWSSVLVTVK